MTGGYSLIDCFDVNITSEPVKIEGIFKKYQMSKRKAFLLSNVTINNTQLNDVFSTPYFEDGEVCFPAYDGVIKISDTDYVTFEATADVIADMYLSKEEFLTIESDNTPYVSRTARDGLVKIPQLVGATVAWNQLEVFDRSSGTSQGVGYTNNNDGSFTLDGTATSDGLVLPSKTASSKDVENNHVYYAFSNIDLSTGIYLGILVNNATKKYSYTVNKFMYKPTNDSGKIQIGYKIKKDSVIDNQIIFGGLCDLTLMFGTTIADYVYSLEQATEGSGIAWLKSYGFFTEDYYAYDAGSLQSVCTSGRKITALDGTVRTYPIDNEELRGLFKLDANNKLYADGDVYPSSGSGRRKHAVLANQTGAIGDTITLTGAKSNTAILSSVGADIGTVNDTTLTLTKAISGADILYELATETTFSADPYINPQRSEGTEEFVDGLTRDVMIPVGNESTYYKDELFNIIGEYIDSCDDAVIAMIPEGE